MLAPALTPGMQMGVVNPLAGPRNWRGGRLLLSLADLGRV